MSRDASQIAPPGYFEHAEEERKSFEKRKAELSNEALLARIEKLESAIERMSTPISHPNENFPRF